MVKNHLKRLNAPKTWPIRRKETVFITRPLPGKKMTESIPLSIVFKDMLKKAQTTKEVKHILTTHQVVVNGKARKNHRYGLGLMDVLVIPKTKESFRMLINKKGKLTMIPIDQKESAIRLVKVKNKKLLKKKRLQINTHDGTSVLAAKDEYRVGDTLVLNEKNQIKEVLKLKKGAVVLMTKGKHVGIVGTVQELKDNVVKIKYNNHLLESKKDYLFVIGRDKPIIKTE
jgi:small subunit ribosomal protein S4e